MKKMKMILPMILLSGGLGGCTSRNAANTYDSLVTVDVNPGIQLKLDNRDYVIEAVVVNDDAHVLLEDIDLKKVDAKVAINALLGEFVKENYLTSENNTVLLSVDNNSKQKRERLKKQLSEEIQEILKDLSIEGAVFSQNLDIDDDVERLVKKYDISYGKAALIEKILDADDEQKTYTVKDLVKLDIQDLVLIYQQKEAKDDKEEKRRELTGTINTSKHISKDKALAIVLKDAGLIQSQIRNLKIELDDNVYEIDFDYRDKDYSYNVHVNKGIVYKDIERRD